MYVSALGAGVAGAGTGALAYTGVDVVLPVAGALVLVVTGLLLLRASRFRSQRSGRADR